VGFCYKRVCSFQILGMEGCDIFPGPETIIPLCGGILKSYMLEEEEGGGEGGDSLPEIQKCNF